MKGNFEDISVRVGIGMKRSNQSELVNLFDWNIIELANLEVLERNSSR